MTITLYLERNTFLDDLKTLQTIFNAGNAKLVEPMGNFLKPLNISSSPFTNSITINVSLEEFALIGIFNGSNF